MMPAAAEIEASSMPSIFSKCLRLLSPKKPKRATSSHVQQAQPNLSSTSPPDQSSSCEFERVFHYLDEDGDGKISPAELRNCMKSIGEDLSVEEAEDAVASTDSDGDGLLGFEDFVKLVEVEREEEKGRNLRDAFDVYEMKGQDCITAKSLRRTLGLMGETKSIEDCIAMIRRFDLNGDGVISFDEFRIMML